VSAAIVTGGSAGIGRAVVQKLLESGSEVVSLDMKPFPEAHSRLRHVPVDPTDSHATQRLAEDIARAHAVTTLIHNAGTIRPLGHADGVARAVLFFADRDNGFVTGQVLYVCGGTSVGSLVL
jgi:NAD(P)-dependent dehydrogenase (short-subunit alcohol dehydrogenase family)